MFNPTAQQSIKATADGGVYTVGGAGAFGFIPGTWGEWAAAVAVVYGLLQIGVLVYHLYEKHRRTGA